ncbi:MAG: precorrin-4 C(11)-methyltransferase [Lachnospiraceae bacterium]|nr:precorrin-4 C(11)-methyltransferase [Lachnospiraceae bacterium]
MVHFVGAGPGAADLITIRGMELLKKADAVIYAGSLINKELLSYCKKDVRLSDSSKMTLEEVIIEMKENESKGLDTVRLHSGDPSIYGAIREQIDELCKLDVGFDVTPGVTAAMAAASCFGIEYTLPEVAQSFIITRVGGRTPVPETEKIEVFVKSGASVAVYLSTGLIKELTDRLIKAGIDKDIPAALVYKCTWNDEKKFLCRLNELSTIAGREGITNTAIILIGRTIGQVSGDTSYDRSKLYDPGFSTGFRSGTELSGEKNDSGGRE